MTMHQDKAIALSVGDAPDRAKLGFPAAETRRILFNLCTAFIRAGYHIWYAGDLRPGGTTLRMFEFLKGTYAGQDITPFTNVLPENVVRKLTFDKLAAAAKAAKGIAEIKLSFAENLMEVDIIEGELWIRAGTNRVRIGDEPALQDWLGHLPKSTTGEALTAARRSISALTAGRVSMGGRMGLIDHADDVYEGDMPGIAEEAILTLEASGTYVPLAAFGGATRDVAIALGLLPEGAMAPRGLQLDSYSVAMERLARLRERVTPWAREPLQALCMNENAEDVSRRALAIFEAHSAHAKLSLSRPSTP